MTAAAIQAPSRSAIITGASGGFGAVAARMLAADGTAVTLTGRTPGALDRLTAEIIDAGGQAQALRGDVRSRVSVAEVLATHVERFGAPDLLLTAAAVHPVGPVGDIDPDWWWAAMETNVRGPMLWMDAVVPIMRDAGRGRIANVSSLAALMLEPAISAYHVSKLALSRLTQHVASDGRNGELNIFHILPGFAFTGLSRDDLASGDLAHWAPAFAARVSQARDDRELTDAALENFGAHMVQLARGAYDELSGSLLNFDHTEGARLRIAGLDLTLMTPVTVPAIPSR